MTGEAPEKALTIATGHWLLWGWWELRQTGYPTVRGHAWTWQKGFLRAFDILQARDPRAATAVREALEEYEAEREKD